MKSGVSCAGFRGGERVYVVDVPANAIVLALASPALSFDLSLNAIHVTGTSPSSWCTGQIACTTGSNASSSGGA